MVMKRLVAEEIDVDKTLKMSDDVKTFNNFKK